MGMIWVQWNTFSNACTAYIFTVIKEKRRTEINRFAVSYFNNLPNFLLDEGGVIAYFCKSILCPKLTAWAIMIATIANTNIATIIFLPFFKLVILLSFWRCKGSVKSLCAQTITEKCAENGPFFDVSQQSLACWQVQTRYLQVMYLTAHAGISVSRNRLVETSPHARCAAGMLAVRQLFRRLQLY